MSEEDKAARNSVRDYLEALEAIRRRRGRRRTPGSIAARLAGVDEDMAGASALQRLDLSQARSDLKAETRIHAKSGVEEDARVG